MTQYLNGYAFALCTFTPVKYNPGKGKLSYFGKVTVRITTQTSTASLMALDNLPVSEKIRSRIEAFTQNPAMMQQYPELRSPSTNYQYLIISPTGFKNEFEPLTTMYNGKGITSRIVTIDSINAYGTGWDLMEKIRSFMISEYQAYNIEYVLLAGNPALFPAVASIVMFSREVHLIRIRIFRPISIIRVLTGLMMQTEIILMAK